MAAHGNVPACAGSMAAHGYVPAGVGSMAAHGNVPAGVDGIAAHGRVPAGATPPGPHGQPVQRAGGAELGSLVRSLAESVATLAQVTANGQTGQNSALERLADAAADQKRPLRPDKPKLTAATPAALHSELKALRLYFNDARVHDRGQWMAGARAVASGRAMTVLNSYVVQKFGNEEKFQEQLKNKTWSGWEGHWKAFEGLLKVATGLDDASELNEAITIYNNDAEPAAGQFVTVVVDGGPVHVTREPSP